MVKNVNDNHYNLLIFLELKLTVFTTPRDLRGTTSGIVNRALLLKILGAFKSLGDLDKNKDSVGLRGAWDSAFIKDSR